jgi:RNA polymerase sigma factor (sigma-70 family)
MADDTRPSLLIRVRDPQDAAAWQQFAALYEPLSYQFARKRGLQDADAADLTQIVLQAVSASIRRLDYDPQRGSFRGWLFVVVRNQLQKFRAQQRKAAEGTGDTAIQAVLEAQPDHEADDSAVWDREYERQLFLTAAARVRGSFAESSWQAFWLTAVEGKSAQEVSCQLGLTLGAIYTARSRILDKIKRETRLLRED